ncbi:MAG TPA: hypothetical protein VMS77_03035 [Conexivisphaerales archaeon]|nr:hypothetical protein [Conexivisphaerales archaeon]
MISEVRKSAADVLNRPVSELSGRQVKSDHRILALWAADCAEHVLPYFEESHPDDDRPRRAIEACREWVTAGASKTADVRRASFEAHAAARSAKEKGAIAAARAAGHAAATAHVPTHALGSAAYALKAAASRDGKDYSLMRERDWQLRRLREYAKRDTQ